MVNHGDGHSNALRHFRKLNASSQRHLSWFTFLSNFPCDWPEIPHAFGGGAVISNVIPDGAEHPIAFASNTLSPSEHENSQVEKEALSLVFDVHKFISARMGGVSQLSLIISHWLLFRGQSRAFLHWQQLTCSVVCLCVRHSVSAYCVFRSCHYHRGLCMPGTSTLQQSSTSPITSLALIVVITCNWHWRWCFLCQLAHLLLCTNTWVHFETCTVSW